MTKLIPSGDYVFDASAKTITFSDYASIEIERVRVIVNVKNAQAPVYLYNFGDPNMSGSGAVSSNVLTLDYDTTSMDDSDPLVILYDHPNEEDSAITNYTTNANFWQYLRGMVRILSDVWNSSDHYLKVGLASLISGEDLTNDVLKVEQRYSYSRKTADGQVKATAGFVHSVTISPLTASPTAGLLTIYDNTSETGTVIFSEWVFATTPAHTVILNVPCSTGIYVGFDGTLANVAATVAYR